MTCGGITFVVPLIPIDIGGHMKTRTRRIAGIAAVGLLAGGGLASAFAATNGQGNDPAGDLANALSKETGSQVSSTQVKAAFKDVLKARLDKGVADGRLTQAQADEILARAGNGPMLGMGGPRGDHGPGRGFHRVDTAIAKALASALGVTESDLQAAREAGKSPTALGAKKGVSRDDLVAVVTAALKKAGPPNGARVVTDGRLAQMAGGIVDGTGPGGHGPRGPGGHGPWGP